MVYDDPLPPPCLASYNPGEGRRRTAATLDDAVISLATAGPYYLLHFDGKRERLDGQGTEVGVLPVFRHAKPKRFIYAFALLIAESGECFIEGFASKQKEILAREAPRSRSFGLLSDGQEITTARADAGEVLVRLGPVLDSTEAATADSIRGMLRKGICPPKPGKNDERDQWLLEQWEDGASRPAIVGMLKNRILEDRPHWNEIDEPNGIKAAIDRYSRRHHIRVRRRK